MCVGGDEKLAANGARASVAVLGAALLIHLVQAVAVVLDQGADEPLPDDLLGLIHHVTLFVAQRNP